MPSPVSKRRNVDGGLERYVFSRNDEISRFPDEILCHILSFLPTKDAVRTSILSNRWKNVWTSVPCIDIDDEYYSLSTDSISDKITTLKNCFMKFVSRVLQLNDVPTLRKFRLNCYEKYDPLRVSSWFSVVAKRDIEELDLSLFGYHPQLPPTIFTSTTLVILKLKYLGTQNFPAAKVQLPSLKRLHLQSVALSGHHTMKNLIDGCPIIDTLDMVAVICDNVNTLFIQSSSLKSLRVHNVYLGVLNSTILRIAVDATNLEQLDVMDDVKVQFDLINLSSLVKLKIGFYDPSSRVVQQDVNRRNRLFEILRKSPTAKYLSLSGNMMKYLEYARWDTLHMFGHVYHLEVDTYYYSWPVLPDLLECFPNLTTFVYNKEGPGGKNLQFKAPKCLLKYLEEIKLTGFNGCDGEMEMATYFLRNAPALKKLSIKSCYSRANKQLDVTKKLLTIPRGSSQCPIIFL